MSVRTKRLGQTLLVHLDGELDLHSSEPFKQTVLQAFASDRRLRNVVLLMNGVSFVDSSGVGAILGRYRDAVARGGRLAVVGLQVPVKRVFELSGMLKILPEYESEGHALANL